MHGRHFIGSLGAFCMVAVAGCTHRAAVDSMAVAPRSVDATSTAALVELGQYLAEVGDCEFCHTRAGGQRFAGGRAVPTPFGKIFSVNITPDLDTGIGRWSEQDFYRAMHEGIRKDGSHLYPAFPYPWFTKLSRGDVDAIRAYLATVKPVRQEDTPNQLPWYLRWRGVMAWWNLLYFHEGEYQPEPNHSADWNRGAYLAQGLAHCSACHTPINALGGSKHDEAYQGGNAGMHWVAPGLNNALHNGVGNWTSAEIVEYLKTGSNAKSASAGPMTEVVMNSTQHFRAADLEAIAVFLKDRPQAATKSPREIEALDAAVLARGEALYTDNCIGCHMPDGRGVAKVFPPLTGSSAIQADQAGTAIHVVLAGARMADPSSKPTGLAMPGFGWKMSDNQVADVVNYIRQAWGNRAPPVGADAVAAVRKDIVPADRRLRDPARHGG